MTTPLNRETVQSSLLERAQNDAEFRTLLLNDPHAAIKSLLSFDPIPALNIRVIEEQPGEVVLVLPRNLQEDELPDEMLDMASGGWHTTTPIRTYIGHWYRTDDPNLIVGNWGCMPEGFPANLDGKKFDTFWPECDRGEICWVARYK